MDDVTDKNLFSYCDNNPIMRLDEDGEFWQLALAGGGSLASTWAVGRANAWNPVGLTIIGVATIGTIVYCSVKIYKYSKSKSDPYARPGQKKQGRENKEKKKLDDKKWKPKGLPKKPKKHTPGRNHRKYW